MSSIPSNPSLHTAPAPSLSARLHAWRLSHANVEFALLGTLATALALYAGMVLELKAPYTAAVTVWVVANTRPGHVVSKSLYRVLGTLCGAAFSVFAVACFDSTPGLLFIALAVWVGFCTFIGNLLRHFRGYFGLLAGYTAAFIVFGAYTHPDRILDYALDRTSAIVIGVLSMSLVVSVLGVRRSPAEILETLRRIHQECLEAITGRWDKDAAGIVSARLALNADLVKVEATLEYANLESPGFHHRIHRLRALTDLLMDGVDASRLTQHHLKDLPEAARNDLIDLYSRIRRALEAVVRSQNENGLSITRERLTALLDEAREMLHAPSTRNCQAEALQPAVAWLESAASLMDHTALDAATLRSPFLGEPAAAIRQGLRAMAAMLVSAGFWMLTNWQAGAAFAINGAAFCALASTMRNPVRGAALFAQATTVSAIAGFICKFYLLPQAEGFIPMVACLAAVLAPIGLLAFSRNALLDGIGVTSGLFLLALVQPSNHMTYDPAQYLSSAIAAVFGGIVLIPVYAVVLPIRPEKEAAIVLNLLSRRVRKLAASGGLSLHAWRILAHHRIQRLRECAQVTQEQLRESLRLLDLGSSLASLHALERIPRVRRLSEPLAAALSSRRADAASQMALLAQTKAELREASDLEPAAKLQLASLLSGLSAALSSQPDPACHESRI